MLDIRGDGDDRECLKGEIERRDKIIDALMYQVEHALNAQDTDYGLLQTTFLLEDQVRQRTEELIATLNTLSEVTTEAADARHRLEAAVESISEGFALFDEDDRILLCNEAFCRIWGIAENAKGQFTELLREAASRGWLGGVPAEDFFERLTAIRRGDDAGVITLPGGQSLQIRERRTPEGTTVGIYTDVTDLKAEEARVRQQALARKSELLQSTLDTIAQGIAVFSAGAELVAWNRRFFSLNQLPDGLARIGARLSEFLAEDAALVDPLRLHGGHLTPDNTPPYERTLASGAVLEVNRFAMPDGGFVITASDITRRKESERRIGDLLRQQRAIFENAHVGIVLIRERTILDANPRMAEMFGYTSTGNMIGRLTEFLFPTPEDFRQAGERVYRELGDKGYCDEYRQMKRSDGKLMWIHLTGRPLDPAAPDQGSIWVYSDVTRLREQQQQLELAQTVFNNSNEALLVTDADNCIQSVNTAFTAITGYQPEEVIGLTPSILKSGYHDEEFYSEMWSKLLAEDRWDGELFDRHKSGRIYPKWLTIRVVRNDAGGIAHFVAAFSDISARKAAEERVQYMAHHDALTGLPNRMLLQDRFEQMKKRVAREGQSMGMYFLDLDHFKRINDTLGHAVGDELLVAVTQRLRGCLRESDTISRLGGDEFIILAEGGDTPRHFGNLASKILQALDDPFDIGGHLLTATSSIGVAIAPGDGQDFDTLMKKADIALYHAKDSGRGTFSFFDARMNRDSAERLTLTSSLRKALSRHEMRLVYQPQYALDSARMTGVEALLRWRSELHGDVPPDRFIPIAEETGLILPVGEWVMHEACRQAREWNDQGQPIRMAVNVSGVQIYRDDFSRTLLSVLRDTRVDPSQVELELTESTLMEDSEAFNEVIAFIKTLGMSVAIDDFGTGYSSLAYLKRFHVSKLKVDRSFVTDICRDDEDRAIAEAIVRMGQSLKLKVIAEGVETREQLDFLATIGCHEGQGYFLSRPVEAEALVAMRRYPPVFPSAPTTGARSDYTADPTC
ncbi:MAG TPA: EAL domain-containing protein [Rhodocyclaceae bacterium]